MRRVPGRFVVSAILLCPLVAYATPVAYTFSGDLTGVLERLLPDLSQTIIDIPFQVAVIGDTNTVQDLGFEASNGPSVVNNSSYATWTVSGLGTVSTNTAEVYISPSLGRISLDWNGQVYPASGTAGTLFDFTGSAFSDAFAPERPYRTLSDIVGPTSAKLLNDLRDSGGSLSEFDSTFALYLGNSEILHVQDLTNVTYSVEPVPLPPTGLLLLSGVAAMILVRPRRYRHSAA